MSSSEPESYIAEIFFHKNIIKTNINPNDIIKYNLLIIALNRNNYTIFNKLLDIVKTLKENKNYKHINFSEVATNTLKNIIDNQRVRQRTRKDCYSQYSKWTTQLLNLGANTQLIIDYYTDSGDEIPITNTLETWESISVIGAWRWNSKSKLLERYWYKRFLNFDPGFLEGWLQSEQKNKIYEVDICNWLFNIRSIYLLMDTIDTKKLKYINFLKALRQFITIDFHINRYKVPELSEFTIDESNIDMFTIYVSELYDVINRFEDKVMMSNHFKVINQSSFSNWDLEDTYFSFLSLNVKDKINNFINKNFHKGSLGKDFDDIWSVKEYKERKQKRKDGVRDVLLNSTDEIMYTDVINEIIKYTN
jgi:hypothetical protein